MNRRQHLRQIARQFRATQASAKELSGGSPIRPLASLCGTLPPWAESAGTRLLVSLDRIPGALCEEQKWGVAIAAAVATGSPQLMQAVLRDAEGRIPHQTRDLARVTAVAALLAQGPNLNVGSSENGGTSASRSQNPDVPMVELFALAATAARTGQADHNHRIEAARGAGLPDELIASIVGIAHTFAVVATLLNGRGPQETHHGRERFRAS